MMKIEALYMEACNLYGDGFNMTYLEKSLAGKAEFIHTSFNNKGNENSSKQGITY